MTHSTHTLRQVLVKIRELSRQARPVLAVFDLDSTLFDVSPRLERILLDFAAIPENQKNFPDQIPLFKNIKTLRTDWGIVGALKRAGLDGHHPEFQHAVKEYWMKSFFSSHYLQYDQPYEGAVEYVQAVAESGSQIAYLTGRDVARMGQGSIDVLKAWEFPLDNNNHRLVLKPHLSMDDAKFKTDWFVEQSPLFAHTLFFENEPVNVHALRERCPEVEIIFMDSTHAGHAEPPPDIPKIMNFLCDLKED